MDESINSSMDEAFNNFGKLFNPYCYGQEELSTAHELRDRVAKVLRQQKTKENVDDHCSLEISQIPAPLFTHVAHGLAYTIGSALGCTPPSFQECLDAFLVPNKAGLTAGARAWSKHSHRSVAESDLEHRTEDSNADNLILTTPGQDRTLDDLINGTPEPKKVRPPKQKKKKNLKPKEQGFWGIPSGPVSSINSLALALFHKICDSHNATWRNVHWLPHHVLVYEVRVKEGYGMRWSQDWGGRASGPWPDEDSGDAGGSKNQEKLAKDSDHDEHPPPPWTFRGFVEPMMENGHELKWRHPTQIDHPVSSD